MKKLNYISKAILVLLLIVSVKFSGCEQEDLDFYVDCDFCLESIPEYDTLWVFVTLNDENSSVPLEFFIGDYEDGQEDWIDTARVSEFFLVSEVGVEYSVKATYKQGDEVIVAIDGDKIRVVDGEGDCYPPCYYTRGGTLDVRLKEK